jgi:hypothetical protein
MWWLTPPWGAKIRRRQILAQAREWQAEERRRAYSQFPGVARILDDRTLDRADRERRLWR